MKAMNFTFILTAVLEIFTLFYETEALFGWKWKSHSKDKPWRKHRNVRGDGCISGTCVQSWKCPDDALSEKPTGSCAYWINGPWVCCTILNDISANYPKHFNNHGVITSTKRPTYVNSNSPKQTANSWRHTSSTSTENPHNIEESWNTPCLEDPWNRNARERPTPISALGDIPSNSWDKSHTFYSVNKPTLKPLEKQTKTSHQWNKPTSPHALSTRITNTWNKPSTSDTRIVFPSESAIWTQKLTKLQTTATYSWKKTTRIIDQKPSYTTTTTKNKSGVTSKVPKTTPGTNSRKPSARPFTTVLPNRNEGRDQSWGKSTFSYSTRRQNTEKSKPPSTTSVSVRRTTRRSGITTPLPDVNTYPCGVRELAVSNRRKRSLAAKILFRESKSRDEFQRIVGGKEAEPFSWPWVAALYKVTSSGGYRFLSAGALINENFILTAAHVFTPDDLRTSSYVVMLGTHNAEDAVAEYRVSSVLQHPNYEQRYYYNDIALLKLERSVVFNEYVMPVCLPSPKAPLLSDRDLEGKKVTVMGWGDDSFGGKSSRVLKEASFPIVSRRTCNASYVKVASNSFPKGITDSMLCAGDPNGGKDACQGDSGGPLTSIEGGRYTQVGIVSFGYQCGDKEFPGVYTKVAPYLRWIADNTQDVNNHDYYHDYDYGV